MIFDTHAHYDSEEFDRDREAMIASLRAGGLGAVCNIGASLQGARDSAALAARYPFFYAAVGIHPDECAEMTDDWITELRRLASEPRVVAIGEIGLDYHGFGTYPDKVDKETQMHWFLKQLELAKELDLPVVIHSRNAAEDTMRVMQEAHASGLRGGIIHCYSYSAEQAKEYVRMGFYIGLGGVVTYEGQRKVTKVLRAVPLSQMVLETDSPYLAPEPYRGRRNCSLYLTFVRDKIAQIKGVTPEEVEEATWENAHRVYGIGTDKR